MTADQIVVSGRLDDTGPGVVRLVPSNPIGAQLALHAIGSGQIGAALLVNEQELVDVAREQIAAGLTVVSRCLVELANSSTSLTERQKEILVHLASGLCYGAIAREIHLSKSTLKREMRKLDRLLQGLNSEDESGTKILDLLRLSPKEPGMDDIR